MEEDKKIIYVCHIDIKPIMESNEKIRVYLSTYVNGRRFQVFLIELKPGCNYQSIPHSKGSEEYIVIIRE